MPFLIVGVVLIALIAFLIWWLFFETEGVYLGRRVVIWLYDVYAKRYDSIVQVDEVDEHLYLAQPLLARLQPNNSPLVLDVATGTGRLPLALCQHPEFEGHIIGLDLSYGMLKQAIEKIEAEHFDDYVTFIWANGQALPFPDNSFDVVTCLEALEFMPQPEQGLAELLRVLRPNGLLLTTLRIHQPWMPTRIWSAAQMREKLEAQGAQAVELEAWLYDYSKVWARKR